MSQQKFKKEERKRKRVTLHPELVHHENAGGALLAETLQAAPSLFPLSSSSQLYPSYSPLLSYLGLL